MKTLRCAVVAWLLVSLVGCGLLSSFYEKPKDGGPSPAEAVQAVAKSLPYGEIISGVIGIGGLIFGANRHAKHKKTHKENVALKKQVNPPAPPTPPAAAA